MSLGLTFKDFVEEFPGLKSFCGTNEALVTRKLAEAEEFTNISILRDQARYVVLRRARWLLHLDGCAFATKEQAQEFKKHLDRVAYTPGPGVV